MRQLNSISGPPITVRNDVDELGPPTNFTFVAENLFHKDLQPPDPEARIGCNCRYDARRKVGCEYLRCECLEDVVTNEDGKPVGFPYHSTGEKKDLLRNVYLEERHHIYECNDRCTCSQFCKNRVVQRGRQVPLEIFKTNDRGWGEPVGPTQLTLLTIDRAALPTETPKRPVHRHIQRRNHNRRGSNPSRRRGAQRPQSLEGLLPILVGQVPER